MAWVEERKTTFSGVTEQDEKSGSSQNGFKRNSYMSQYLHNEKQEVIFGGYTPSVTDGAKLTERLIQNRTLPHPRDGNVEDAIITVPLCIGLIGVENVLVPFSFFNQVEGINNVEFQLRVSLFDLAYHQFFGRQWAGQYSELTGIGGQSKPKLRLSQNIYFHTSIVSSNIVAVVELVSSGLDEGGRLKKISCGWGIIRPFRDEEIPDTARGIKPPTQKCQLYNGTPRALYFMDEPIEDCEFLRPIPDCELGFTIATHKAMYKVTHLLPENTVVGNNDVIPGLFDSDSAAKDKLKKPKKLKSSACTIEHVTLQLNPTIEKFEEELCETLQEDRLNMMGKHSDGTSVVIMERRLLVGVHNGWTFVEKPQTFLLDAKNISMKSLKPGASPTFRRSQRFKSSHKSQGAEDGPDMMNHLVLNQRVHINDLLEDPMFAVVFILEYVIGEQLSAEDRKMARSIQRGNTRSVTLRWSAWNPFLQQHNSPHVTVGLFGGPIPSPDGEFVYKVPDTAMQDEISSRTAGGLMAFQWGFGFKESVSSGIHPTHPMALAPGFPMGSAHSMRSMESSDVGMMVESPTAQRKPPSGRPLSSRGPAGPTTLAVPQQVGAGSVLQPQQVPMQYPQVYAQSMPQQMYIPMHQGPVQMYGMPGPVPDMQELRYTPSYQPILTAAPQPKKGSGLSRAAYAKLYSVGFPPVLDRNGEPPEVIDPNTHVVTVDLQREMNDPLQCNEVIFQFLAFSKMMEHIGASGPEKTGGTVFFSFQFYRNQQVTTERLLLSKPQNDLSSDIHSMPYILHKLDKDGTLLKGPPGLEIRYFMDPAFMKPGETQLFLQHLSQQTMYIDVWDGDSLLPLGSTALELKYLCRTGMEAVQTTFELDVVSTEYQEDPNLAHGEAGAGGVRPANVQSVVRGKLHLRLANIGHPADPKSTTTAYISLPSKSFQIVSQTASNSAFGGGSLIAGGAKTEYGVPIKKRVARAHHVAENNREVAALLFSKREEIEPVTESHREADSERQRKLARMQALRNQDGGIEKPQTLMAHKQLKTERARDLKTMEIYRMQTKKEGIEAMLSQSITTEHAIHPSFGTSEFFEFVLRNPFNVEHTVKIEWESKNLHCVTDTREWRYFKQLYQIQSHMEEGMFTSETKAHFPEVFLRPKETVNIPFKYLSFLADQSAKPQGPVDPFRQTMKRNTSKPTDSLRPKTIKVYFKSEDEKPLAILLLKVEPQPHVIDQTFRFHSPEQTFLKKSIRLPPLESLPGAPVGSGNVVHTVARCSDPNIICDTKTTQPGEPQDVFVKVPLGASPQIKKFFMAVYLDPFMARPIQIWQFYVHALQRVDVSAVEGQTSRFSLLLRGTQASRLVKCFSSHPDEMTLYPTEQFMLAAGAVHELNVAVRPMQEGNKFFYINVVDVEFHQLVRTWLICVSSRAPMISRAFELALPVGGGKGCSKKITYTNPYPHKKTFLLHSNREDLLQFKESTMEIEGGGTSTIGLRFVPIQQAGTAEILVFINDEEDKNEETFRVTAVYQRM
ncbi:nephrocystin-4-like isoform X2 [Mercenaria mercenaria]|uniref:nephrocystin-4-like isoform X2 n=1 Tax=Mercenaria mercenaria TaxID=6596 RepID=UPI00234ED261|nr:nephrocystin-4-like isoform X2 [Mercenaria mercenaria]